MTFSIKPVLDAYVATTGKVWGHDRLSTIGASEIGLCSRRIYYSKNETPPDPDYIDRWGARVRGTIIEDVLVAPALKKLNESGNITVLWAGDEQRTIASGFLSATPDALVHRTFPDRDAECFLVEIKSLDPRVDLRKAKDAHAYQVQVQMGLVREFTNYSPSHAIICYLDASFLDDVTEFRVEFDQRIYDAAAARAKAIMGARSALDLKPEGAIAGGNECHQCPFKSRCRGDAAAAHPKDKGELDEEAAAQLARLIETFDALTSEVVEAEFGRDDTKFKIKELLRANNVKWTEVEGRKVNWQSRKGKVSLDTKAMERDGIDLSKYQVEGDPYDVLVIK